MSHTPEQAKELWCPMVRLAGCLPSGEVEPGQTVVNRLQIDINSGASIPDSANCIANICAMWVWQPDAHRTLGNGMVATVDTIDADILRGQPWWWHGRYVKGNQTYLHRAVVERQYGTIPPGLVVDHIDGDPLNNRRLNLRICLQAENVRNNKPKAGKKSRYKGVFPQISGRWTAQITYKGKRKCLGTYDTEEIAAAAYDNAAKCLVDEYIRTNLQQTADGRHGYCGLAGRPEVM